MHILLVTNTQNGIWGADRDWINLANSLADENIKITWAGIEGTDLISPHLNKEMLSGTVDTNLPGFFYLINEQASIKRSKILWLKIVIDHLIRLQKPFRRLRNQVKGQKFDLVVSNTAVVTLGAIYAKLYGLPHVWFIKETLDPFIKDSVNYAKLISKLSNRVVVPSASVAKAFSKQNNIEIIHDGNDVKTIISKQQSTPPRDYLLQSLNLPNNRLVVAQVGAFYHIKGQQVTAKAFVELSKKLGYPAFSLLFLGKSVGNFQNQLENILLDVPESWRQSVKFINFELNDFSYMELADIVVHPSVGSDSFPNALREAMILGKATIGSQIGGITEIIQSENTGILIPPGNVNALVTALDDLIQNEDKRREIGKQAKEFAVKYFDIENRKQPFIQVLRESASISKR